MAKSRRKKSCDNFVNRREASFVGNDDSLPRNDKEMLQLIAVCCLDSTIAGMVVSHLLGGNEE
jgi:hypothetical protein